MNAREARLIALKIATRTLVQAREELYADYGEDTEKVKKAIENIVVELTDRKAKLQRSLDSET